MQKCSDELKQNLVRWRHYLHQHPETAFEEFETGKLIVDNLKSWGWAVTEGVGKTGIVASLTAGDSSTCIGIRADMDAINLQEQGEISYASDVSGKMHGCGHDGHVTMLLGAAKMLSEARNFNGTVRLVFQPSEEPGGGAKAMIADGLFERFPMDEIYGLHNVPFLRAGKIRTRVGGIMASEDKFEIRITGKGGHASSPHEGIDPFVCFAEIYLALQTIVSRTANPLHPLVISCTEIKSDGAPNAIPTNIVVKGDVRCYSEANQVLVEERMRSIVDGVCRMNNAFGEVSYSREFIPLINSEECVVYAGNAAQAVAGIDNVELNGEPWMASEDFADFLKVVPGCFVLLGGGQEDSNNIPLHSPLYNFNDDILTIGAEFWTEFVAQRLC